MFAVLLKSAKSAKISCPRKCPVLQYSADVGEGSPCTRESESIYDHLRVIECVVIEISARHNAVMIEGSIQQTSS